MSKPFLFVLFTIVGGIVLGLGVFNSLISTGAVKPASHVALVSPAATVTSAPQVLSMTQSKAGLPVTFSIPKLGVKNAAVESVGLDKENKMDVPKDADNVGWYNLGAKPGEIGSAVMAGHLDKKDGSPAVFYNIKDLKQGDEISVSDEDGNNYTFIVTDVKTYELSKFPLEEVFAKNDKARLNLITCEGTFNKSSQLYSHRLVVYSELKS